jgi:hypothetical protein
LEHFHLEIVQERVAAPLPIGVDMEHPDQQILFDQRFYFIVVGDVSIHSVKESILPIHAENQCIHGLFFLNTNVAKV